MGRPMSGSSVNSVNPLVPPRSVSASASLAEVEVEVLERWRARDVFAKSVRLREGAQRWVFYEGPPTANGRPGAHHVLSRVFKDIYPRYKTMRGFQVDRKGGWDCHGLPVEIAVEQELGLRSKTDIERYGIEAFNAKCRESVFAHLQEWDRLTERIGFWIDLEHAYRTLDESYIESVWWAVSQIAQKNLLYEGHKVVPYCPRCGTTLSSHEVALGYEEVSDPSVYVKLTLTYGEESLLIWTTTPWTLPGNLAVAVGPDIEYAKVRVSGEILIVAAALAEKVLGEGVEVVERFPGSKLLGRFYKAPIFSTGQLDGGAPIIAGDFVTTEDGTGLVHIAPAFGEDDMRAAIAAGLVDEENPHSVFNPVRSDGTYGHLVRSIDGRRSYEGRFVKDPQLNEELIEDLRQNGLLFRREEYEHSYPHCWRCGTPLIYYQRLSWYIRTTAVRESLLRANESVSWHPPHIKHGRFGEWLKGNVDWALSRERYWGTPLPVWRCRYGHTKVIGSFAELERLSGRRLEDHHRPYVDEIEFPCEDETGLSLYHGRELPAGKGVGVRCGEPMRRVPEVIDVWFDSGAMPFAQHHWPAENDQSFREHFPADFICEALDQTRGWFYSLLAISTLLFDQAPYRDVLCLGLILDAEGQKMSKSRGNAVEPWQVIDTWGADAFRWYFFTSKQPWDGYRFSEEAIAEGVRRFLKQLWSTYCFYVLYAHANERSLAEGSAGEMSDLDRWALSRTSATVELVTDRLDDYDATAAGRAVAELVDDLSNWYVRRSRRRFWDGDAAAFRTLRQCLIVVCRLLAPFCPFVADEIYDNLDGTLDSVHLCDFPTGSELGGRDLELERAMATARQTVKLGLAARAKAKVKVRQPLSEAVVVADGRERAAIERLVEIVREELNVRQVRFVDAAGELSRYELKANYRRLGPIFGREMPLVAEAIAALDADEVAKALLSGEDRGRIGISVGGREHALTSEDVVLTMIAPEGYSVEREGAHAVALELRIDEDLRREGLAREIVHAVQGARRNAGLAVEDRIVLTLSGGQELIESAAEHEHYLCGETLAVELELSSADLTLASDGAREPERADPQPDSRKEGGREHAEEASIDGLPLLIALRSVTA